MNCNKNAGKNNASLIKVWYFCKQNLKYLRMKKSVLTFSLACLCIISAMAQKDYNVSTEVEKKNVLLEEFTGIHCGWCPEGHKMATVLLNSIPNNAYVVAVHTGYYSEPYGSEPDYRTDMGEAINTAFDANSAGFPSGMINRSDFGRGVRISGRNRWNSDANLIRKQDAPVNLYIESKYDGNTGIVNVHVEGYYTAEPSLPSQQILNVILTQDNISGPQNSGGAGDDYIHNHMLRDNITPLLGDTLTTMSKGQYFSRDYTYTLPADIKSIKVKPEDINIVAYVEDNIEVANVIGGKPLYSNYNETEAGAITTPLLPVGIRYGYNFFEAFLKNNSSKIITNATFDVTVNGKTTSTTINCNVDQFASSAIRVPAVLEFAEKGYTKYEVKLTHMNGVAVEGNSISGNIQKPLLTGSTIRAQIMTDDHASQNTFILYDADGKKVKEFGPYLDWTATTYNEEAELEDGKTYCLEVYDSWGNGILDGGKGGLITRTGWDKLIDQYYTITNYGVRSFFTCDLAGTADAINEIETSAETSKTIHSIDGLKLYNAKARGLYIVRDASGTHKVIIKKQ